MPDPAAKAIGIDIGGTKIAIAAVNADGTIAARRTIATDAEAGVTAALGRTVAAVRETLDEAAWQAADIAGIGLGCPGAIEAGTRRIKDWSNLPGWDGADILTPLEQAFARPVATANDAEAALLGEARWGAARGVVSAVMFTIGTGVGGAAMADGHLLRGTGGSHPELGHLPVLNDGPRCYCGMTGCYESIASGPAIAAAGHPHGYPDAEAVFTAAASGTADAQAILARVSEATARAVHAVLHACDPAIIVFGGGIAEAQFPVFAEAAQDAARQAALVSHAVRVAPAALGNDAGLVGAATLVLEHPAGAMARAAAK